ncbi:MAG: hypothetical protein ACTS3F_06475 [Phycisphaerales bacterium]
MNITSRITHASLTAALLTLTACSALPRITATNDTAGPVDLQIATPHPPPGTIQSPTGYHRVMLKPGETWDSRRDAPDTFVTDIPPWGISGQWVFIATAPDLLQGHPQTAEARLRATKPTTLRIETHNNSTLTITPEPAHP